MDEESPDYLNEEWILIRGWADWNMTAEHHIGCGGRIIAKIPFRQPNPLGDKQGHITARQAWDDAKLIACAPELYTALMVITEHLERVGDNRKDANVLDESRRVIDKVRNGGKE